MCVYVDTRIIFRENPFVAASLIQSQPPPIKPSLPPYLIPTSSSSQLKIPPAGLKAKRFLRNQTCSPKNWVPAQKFSRKKNFSFKLEIIDNAGFFNHSSTLKNKQDKKGVWGTSFFLYIFELLIQISIMISLFYQFNINFEKQMKFKDFYFL